MYDPLTVAHEVKIFGRLFITIWHVDSETDGTDDSCGWAFANLDDEEKAYAEYLITDEYDNLYHWFDGLSKYDAISHVMRIFRLHKTLKRPWWQHPRWHFWHWRFQVHPTQKFKRWAFSRCAHCNGRFGWDEVIISHQWGGTGPMWFSSEKKVFHEKCSAEALRS